MRRILRTTGGWPSGYALSRCGKDHDGVHHQQSSSFPSIPRNETFLLISNRSVGSNEFCTNFTHRGVVVCIQIHQIFLGSASRSGFPVTQDHKHQAVSSTCSRFPRKVCSVYLPHLFRIPAFVSSIFVTDSIVTAYIATNGSGYDNLINIVAFRMYIVSLVNPNESPVIVWFTSWISRLSFIWKL